MMPDGPEDGRALGKTGERAGVDFLRRLKYQILAKNFRFQRGEIDIVARDGSEIVFIEVKTRRGRGFGDPEESVTAAKQGQLRKIALGYLMKNNLPLDTACRFDVLSLVEEGSGRFSIVQIRNAF